MKTKELVRRLQECDPSGEEHVVVDNKDIFFVTGEPAYHDGVCEELIRDPSVRGYNIVGGKFRSGGYKIQIVPFSIEDALLDNPELPVDFSDLSVWQREQKEEKIFKAREEMRQIIKDADEGFRKSMEKWFQEFLETQDVNVLEKHFGGYLNELNNRKDVKLFLQTKCDETKSVFLQNWLYDRPVYQAPL